ncbi:MAG: ubiquitin-like domain-containing protein [Bacillota bacterium]|jgi:uncharacterized protein YabE (DUF348 family)
MKYANAHQGRPRGVVKSVIIVLTMLLIVFCFMGYAWMEKDITIVIDGETLHTKTFKSTVEDVLEEKDIAVYPKDQVVPSMGTRIENENIIKITRAFPAEIQVDGKKLSVETLPVRVADVLAQAGVDLGEKDIVQPGLETIVKKGAPAIKVSRIKEELITRKQKIAFHTEQKADTQLERGIRRIVRKGKEGLKEETIKVTYKDGEIINQELVSTKVLAEPVSKIVAVGTLQFASRGGQRFQFEKVMEATATAYTHTGRRTACGTVPKVGTVAVDPSQIPLGSKLYVEGYGFGKAEDTGGSIRGQRIDVFLETEGEARRWGRKNVKVYVLK